MINYIEYTEQLKDIRWLKCRNKILHRDNYKCTKCGSKECLNIHHLYYVYDNKAWEYPNSAFITLCSKCHEEWHNKYDIVIRGKYTTKGYTPPKKKKVKLKNQQVVKYLSQYNIPSNLVKLINTEINKRKGVERTKFVKLLELEYKYLHN